jgi:hypothetical protein
VVFEVPYHSEVFVMGIGELDVKYSHAINPLPMSLSWNDLLILRILRTLARCRRIAGAGRRALPARARP